MDFELYCARSFACIASGWQNHFYQPRTDSTKILSNEHTFKKDIMMYINEMLA